MKAVHPGVDKATDGAAAGQGRVSFPLIIGLVVGVLALIGIMVALLFARHRKHSVRISAAPGPRSWRGHRPVSSLTLRCHTHIYSMGLPNAMSASPHAAAQSQPHFTDEKTTSSTANSWSQAYKDHDAHQFRQLKMSGPIHHKASFSGNEGISSHDPGSAVSTESTADMLTLKPYNPSEHAFIATPNSHQWSSYISVSPSPSAGGWSPVETREAAAAWDSCDATSSSSAAGQPGGERRGPNEL